jgi:hypothetical protein
MRPSVSMLPPGGNGMIARTGRSGKLCARAGAAKDTANASAGMKANAAMSFVLLTTSSRNLLAILALTGF